MTARVFLDTNVLVYAAIALIETEDFALSVHVPPEFYVTVVNPFKNLSSR